MKSFLTLICLVFALSLSGQTYKPLRVNEPVHFQDQTFDSCFVVINIVAVEDVAKLKATVSISVYKSQTIYQQHPEWRVQVAEIPTIVMMPIGALFTEGDLFEKISQGIKEYLLAINPGWTSNKIVIVK